MFNHLRHRIDPPTDDTFPAQTVPAALPKAGDGLEKLCLSDTHAIEVEEINPVEFVREWGRAVTKAALAHSIEKHAEKVE